MNIGREGVSFNPGIDTEEKCIARGYPAICGRNVESSGQQALPRSYMKYKVNAESFSSFFLKIGLPQMLNLCLCYA